MQPTFGQHFLRKENAITADKPMQQNIHIYGNLLHKAKNIIRQHYPTAKVWIEGGLYLCVILSSKKEVYDLNEKLSDILDHEWEIAMEGGNVVILNDIIFKGRIKPYRPLH